MDAIEKRARELLASAYAETGAPDLLVAKVRGGNHDTASDNAALNAIIAALTPPEGNALAAAARAAIPFIAYAFNQGVDGAEEAGRAIEAALLGKTPEGYVLVPVEPTEAMIEAICNEHGSGGWPQGYSRYAQHLRREHAGEGYRAMLAARPEVPGA